MPGYSHHRRRFRPRLLPLENREVPATFSVSNLADSGTGSLRAAIQSANSSVGVDTIAFSVTGTISLTSALPTIDEEVLINGGTVPGYAGIPLVTIDGTIAGAGSDGLVFAQGGASVVKGLAIVGFGGTAIHGTGAPGTADFLTIQGNYIGILPDGKTAKGNGVGIRVEFNDFTIIGGAGAGEGNIISGNTTGIALRAWDCTVQGNRIGTNVAGTVEVPNVTGLYDIGIRNIIGGPSAGQGNLISGNSSVGLDLDSASLGAVQGNKIGISVSTGVLGNGIGIAVGRSTFSQNFGSFVIGGALAGQGNTVAFNSVCGILVRAGAREVGILGNAIYQNTGLGIDLSASGNPDGPSISGGQGGNLLPQPPVLTYVNKSGNQFEVRGTLAGLTNQRYRIEFYSSLSADVSRYGEGETLLGAINVTTDSTGKAIFTGQLTSASVYGSISATATQTNTSDNFTTNHLVTSEFSRAKQIVGLPFMATGAGPGGGPHVIVRDGQGNIRSSFYAYDAEFTGGVRVATGDVDGNGVDEVVTGAGSGGGPHVSVFDAQTGQHSGGIGGFFAYDPSFSGGVFVATGDVDGDGAADIITGPGPGGGPHIRIFRDGTSVLLREFFAYDASFTGGVSVAAADVDGDGFADIITGAGPGGGPHVRVFSGATGKLLQEFFAYDASFTGGVNVAAGYIDSDPFADIITGPGAGGGPHVKVRSGVNLAVLRSYFAYDASFTGGVTVAADDLDGDGYSDIFTGTGSSKSQTARLRWWDGKTGSQTQDLTPYGNFLGGLFVG